MDCVQRPAQFNQNNISLQTPQPHYIPGYTGYVPQEKYRPGHSYGKTSNRILLDPCISMSPRSMLNSIYPGNCGDDSDCPGASDPVLSAQMAMVDSSRGNNLGRQQFQPNLAPRYTGFVPRFQNILGHSRSPSCNGVAGGYEQDQWRDKLFTKEIEALDGWKFCYKRKPWDNDGGFQPPSSDLQDFRTAPPANPLMGCGCAGGRQLADSMLAPPQPSGGCCGGGSTAPYSLMTPGYTVCDFAQRRTWGIGQEAGMNLTCGNIIPKVNSFKFSHPANRVQEIYRHCEGMIPNYQGHVPGEIFRTGVTYGTATRNPKRHMEPVLHKPLCFPLKT